MTEEQIKQLQSTGGDHLAATEKNILGNHCSRLWEAVKELRDKTGGRIDFVLDNAGFELYCDCVYGKPYSDASSLMKLTLQICSRFLASKRSGNTDQIPRKAIPLVCVRCDEKGLELVAQHHGVRSSVPQSDRTRARVLEAPWSSLEGEHFSNVPSLRY
jgi:hypothetical protein